MALTNAYTSTDAVNEELGRAFSDTVRMGAIERAINAASRNIDRYTGRPHGFWQDASVTTRVFEADDTGCLHVDDISTATGVIVKTDTDGYGTYANTLTVNTDYRLGPWNAEADGRPFDEIILVSGSAYYFPTHASGVPGVQVTAKFGWAAVPADVEQACICQAVMLYKSPAAAQGIIQVGVDGIPTRIPYMHPTAAALLEGYCKPRVG